MFKKLSEKKCTISSKYNCSRWVNLQSLHTAIKDLSLNDLIFLLCFVFSSVYIFPKQAQNIKSEEQQFLSTYQTMTTHDKVVRKQVCCHLGFSLQGKGVAVSME